MFPVDTSFEKYLFVVTPIIWDDQKIIEKYHWESINNWVGGITNTTIQTCYDIQYLNMHLIEYKSDPTET